MSNHLKGILMVLSPTAMWGLVGILVQYLISSEHFTPEWLLTYSPCLNAGDSWIQTILAY